MYCLLPGMGADHRMYPPPWDALPEVRFLDWPRYEGETNLAQVANRLRASVPIPPETWLIGSSLGGMVACELARQTAVRGVVLIGSATHPSEVSHLLRLLGPMADLAPINLAVQLSRFLPADLLQMFGDSDPAFVRAMCQAIAEWPGGEFSSARMRRIHGRHDLVIPLPARVDAVIDGGHLIAMTHPAECVQQVRRLTAT